MSFDSSKPVDTSGIRIPTYRSRSLSNRVKIAIKDRVAATEAVRAKKAGPSLRQRQDDLLSFYGHYESLVEILCDAAQFGPTSKLERQYAEEGGWIRDEYPKIKQFLSAYLRYTEDDELNGQYRDAFEALVSGEDLAAFLRSDDGGTISRITRTREALNLYGEHLRQLAAKTAA